MEYRRYLDQFLTTLVFIVTQLKPPSCYGAESQFMIEVPARKTECYWQPIQTGDYVKMEISFQVVNGGDLDISLFIYSPQQMELTRSFRIMDNKHTVDLTQYGIGDYMFCFDNSFSLQSSKTVFFEGKTDELKYEQLSQAVLMQDLQISAENFRQSSVKVKDNLNRAEQYQFQRRAIESKDRAVMEANFERVNFWSVVNMVVMLFVLLLQVYMVRSLFNERSLVGRFIRKGKLSD